MLMEVADERVEVLAIFSSKTIWMIIVVARRRAAKSWSSSDRC